MKNCIVYLARSSEQDLNELIKSLGLVSRNVIPFAPETDVIIFIEKSFDAFKQRLEESSPKNIKIIFKEIFFELPNYPQEILDQIPELYPHPTHGNGPIAYWHKGFTMGYRHMCRFFFYLVFQHLKGYNYYMRLDTDSFVLSPLGYNPFEWLANQKAIYSYIEPAVQIDNPLVCQGLNEFVRQWLEDSNIKTLINIDSIQNGTIFYTNFEICKVDWFLENEKIKKFVELIDKSGFIYSRRWGDHILRYLELNLFCEHEKILPIKNFHYQHGAIYKT